MSGKRKDEMLSCSACGQSFIGEPEPNGLNFCIDKCSDEWWEEQERGSEDEEAESAKDI